LLVQALLIITWLLHLQLCATDGIPLEDPSRYTHIVGSHVYLTVKQQLGEQFQIYDDLGPLSYFLGIELSHSA